MSLNVQHSFAISVIFHWFTAQLLKGIREKQKNLSDAFLEHFFQTKVRFFSEYFAAKFVELFLVELVEELFRQFQTKSPTSFLHRLETTVNRSLTTKFQRHYSLRLARKRTVIKEKSSHCTLQKLQMVMSIQFFTLWHTFDDQITNTYLYKKRERLYIVYKSQFFKLLTCKLSSKSLYISMSLESVPLIDSPVWKLEEVLSSFLIFIGYFVYKILHILDMFCFYSPMKLNFQLSTFSNRTLNKTRKYSSLRDGSYFALKWL